MASIRGARWIDVFRLLAFYLLARTALALRAFLSPSFSFSFSFFLPFDIAVAQGRRLVRNKKRGRSSDRPCTGLHQLETTSPLRSRGLENSDSQERRVQEISIKLIATPRPKMNITTSRIIEQYRTVKLIRWLRDTKPIPTTFFPTLFKKKINLLFPVLSSVSPEDIVEETGRKSRT